jgi:hypothetical protein
MDLCEKYFKHFMQDVLGFTNPPFLDEIDDVISNPLYRKIIIALGRGNGKTGHVSIGYPLWEIALDHNLRFLLVANTAGTASDFITSVLNWTETDNYLYWTRWVDPTHKGIVPKMRKVAKKEEKWASSALTIARNNPTLKDPTVRAVGLLGSIVSKRADRIVADDVCSQENTQTEEQRNKVKSWLRTTVMPVLVPDGRFLCIGNTWHEDDAIMTFLRDPQFDYKKRLPEIIHDADNQELWQEWAKIRTDESSGQSEEAQGKRVYGAEEFYQAHKEEMDKGVEILFPYSEEETRKEKEKGRGQWGFKYGDLYLERMADSYSFARMRQCNPADRPDQSFKEAWLDNAKKKGQSLRLENILPGHLSFDAIALGLDLAISETGDDNALLAVGRVRDSALENINPGDFVILNISRGKLPKYTPKFVEDEVCEWDTIFGPIGIRVESVAYQKSMALSLADKGLPIRAFNTGGEKMDPVIGVNRIASLAENGKIVIPYDLTDPRTIDLCSRLINEMRKFPDGHTGDSLMALWFAISELQEKAGHGLTVPRTSEQIARDNAVMVASAGAGKTKELDKQADLEVMRKSEAAKRGAVYIEPRKVQQVGEGRHTITF